MFFCAPSSFFFPVWFYSLLATHIVLFITSNKPQTLSTMTTTTTTYDDYDDHNDHDNNDGNHDDDRASAQKKRQEASGKKAGGEESYQAAEDEADADGNGGGDGSGGGSSDYYAVLGVSADATEAQLKRAYRLKSLKVARRFISVLFLYFFFWFKFVTGGIP